MSQKQIVIKRKPLKLDNLLIRNVNTWGNVQYNIPMRITNNETRTSTNVAHRFIPAIPFTSNAKIDKPLPENVLGRDLVVEKETFRTTSGDYAGLPNPNKAMERADCGMNCKRVHYMTAFEKKLMSKSIVQPRASSEMKDMYRGVQYDPLAPAPITVRPPHTEYIFDVVASGRNEAPVIPETGSGTQKQLDPYLTTYRNYHRPFANNDWHGIGAKDHITFYTEFNVPKTRGFGPKYKPMWMPLQAKVHRGVYDRSYVKKEYHEVASCHNPVKNIKGIMKSEAQSKFTVPFLSPNATWDSGVTFCLAPYPPNPYQTIAPPFMYCTDYCHVKMGTPPNTVIDQIKHPLPAHEHCKEGYIVCKDFGP